MSVFLRDNLTLMVSIALFGLINNSIIAGRVGAASRNKVSSKLIKYTCYG
jgi:hypothetical protein